MWHEGRSPPIADFINGIGQKRTFRDAQATSAITKADIARAFMSARPLEQSPHRDHQRDEDHDGECDGAALFNAGVSWPSMQHFSYPADGTGGLAPQATCRTGSAIQGASRQSPSRWC